MKKTIYQMSEQINEDVFLHYCSMSNCFLFLKRGLHDIYEDTKDSQLEALPENLFTSLKETSFIIDDGKDEILEATGIRENYINQKSLYTVIVNTTLDCNLSCWYCYESRIKGSALTEEVIDGIKNHIQLKFETDPFKTLKLSFFGGEPFMCYEGIKALLTFGKGFCEANGIDIIADFTTNATLVTEEMIDFIRQFPCDFQITLDGDEERHNKIKKDSVNHSNTFNRTIETLRLIEESIPDKWVSVRINFDNRTLRTIDRILDRIDFLDRRKCKIILKKVWQLKTGDVDKEALLEAFNTIFGRKFMIDYYIMPKFCVCNCEQRNQVLFNYDGKVFKCTISSFNDENALGTFNAHTGIVSWDKDRMAEWYADMQPDYCKRCVWFPACNGSCNRQIMAHKGEQICTFDAMNLTRKEYLMYLFKNSILEKELTGIQLNI